MEVNLTDKLVREHAIECGYSDAVWIAEWHGYQVYNPIEKTEGGLPPPCVGMPFFYLAKDEETRETTFEEYSEIDTMVYSDDEAHLGIHEVDECTVK